MLNGIRYKTFAILSHFDDYEVLVWIDHDAVFHKIDTPVEYWLGEKMSPNADLLMAEDIPGYKFNAGVQIIKTTEWAKNFYETAVDSILQTDIAATYLEQPLRQARY